MKKMIKDEGIKFWILIPFYSLINSIIIFILTNIWIVIWYLFWINLALLFSWYAIKDINKKIEEYKNETRN